MDVYWLEQNQMDVPAPNDWLSSTELLYLHQLRFPKRRDDWRLGRWTAKRAFALRFGLLQLPHTLANIEIRPAPSGAPVLFFEDKLAPVTISLSHRYGSAICALAPPFVQLGCDLELIEPHTDAFIADYFTAQEQQQVADTPAADRSALLALLWSAKESALKALHTGLRLDTRLVSVTLLEAFDRNGWIPLRAHYREGEGQAFHGWWRRTNVTIVTLVASPSPDLPVTLAMPPYSFDRSSKRATA
jgi:4'-phosphopantetheinyl transferase